MEDLDKMLNEMIESLFKKQAPILSRRRRRIIQDSKLNLKSRKKLTQKELGKKTYKSENLTNFEQPLAKNEYEVTHFDNGELKMEFGPDVPEFIKKRAMEWAKKRGLKTKEISLGKSKTTNSWVIFK